jgi:hypothetical protein
MDGGVVFQAWVVAKGGGTDGASLPAQRVGNVAAVVAAVVSLGLFFVTVLDREFPIAHPFLDALWWGLFLVAVSYFLEAKAHRERGGDRETEDGLFGYDFSFGYTSLERTATRGERGTALSRLKEKFGRGGPKVEPPSREEIESRLDELLQKIHEKGMASLTRSERDFLKKASRHYRS